MTEQRGLPVVSPAMRKVLLVSLVLFTLLVLDSVYLSSVTFLTWLRGISLEGVFYQWMFLAHLVLGVLIIVPILVYSVMHIRRAWRRPNRLAVRLGMSLFVCVLVLLVSGIALTRGLPGFEVKHPTVRELIYWGHVATPLIAVWLFVLHRLAGPRIRWLAGISIAGISTLLAVSVAWFLQPEQKAAKPGGDFFPALAKTSTGEWIDPSELMIDDYCKQCHEDVHAQWAVSVHRFASFNNPAYRFSVNQTREKVFARDGDVIASRFCAGCHDPVPLFSGKFDDPDFDTVSDETAHAGITCVVCHGIQDIGSVKGNADYVLAPPQHYPLATSDHAALQWLSSLLIKGKPRFHKQTFLKEHHKSAEFCSTCHKVHLPPELNHYKWLRGQNHYDAFLLSGVSGHGVRSYYYPPKAQENCNDCHMPLTKSADFGAKTNDESGLLTIHNHQFPSANTAIPFLLSFPEEVNEAHRRFLEGTLRVDIFGLRVGEDVDAPLVAPIRPDVPSLEPGKSYVLDIVIRSLKVGHLFTQGTSDSNEVWLDVALTTHDETIGRSGGIDESSGEVDPWAHFVNAYILDRDGNRIDQRNAEDIFTKLYDHQIKPGTASVVHFGFTVPGHITEPVRASVSLRYRKFDTTYVRAFQGDASVRNDLPIVDIAQDSVLFGVTEADNGQTHTQEATQVPEWERWNDYGIGLFEKPDAGLLRQAESAFRMVSEFGVAHGSLNLARVYIREGRLDDASAALRSAAAEGAYPWVVAWLSGVVDHQQGRLDSAIDTLTRLLDTQFAEARERGFNFSKDYVLRNRLAMVLFDRAKQETGYEQNPWLVRCVREYQKTLSVDPENVAAHYGLSQAYARLGDAARAKRHRTLHAVYRVDDNAHDRAVSIARAQNPAANHAAEAVVVYDLQRLGAAGLTASYDRD